MASANVQRDAVRGAILHPASEITLSPSVYAPWFMTTSQETADPGAAFRNSTIPSIRHEGPCPVERRNLNTDLIGHIEAALSTRQRADSDLKMIAHQANKR
jgi:hypothetical protein